jgi:NADPH:quinone reductase-like Zn-dependent oxidoreductase
MRKAKSSLPWTLRGHKLRFYTSDECARGKIWALKPASLTFTQAAAIPQAGVIALQGPRNRVQPGQRVLINGGGAGAFAIQLAKRYGADVSAVDNTGKAAFMRSLGAAHVIEYTREDFTRGHQPDDLIFDLMVCRPAFAYARALTSQGCYYAVGGSVATLIQLMLFNVWLRRTSGQQVGVAHGATQSRRPRNHHATVCYRSHRRAD